MSICAHTHPDFPDPKDAATHWEPLFTPFGDSENECQSSICQKCESMDPMYGYFAKVGT